VGKRPRKDLDTESMHTKSHYLTAEIDSSAIIHNCGIFKELLSPHCELSAAVKCNAYGHGIEVVLPALKSSDVRTVCVSSLNEAHQVRQLGWERPVLLLGSEFSIYTGSEKRDYARWIVENQLRITPTTIDDIESLSSAAQALGKPAVIHLMYDSGMSRMGLGDDELLELTDRASNSSYITIEGLYTHFAAADEADKTFTRHQLNKFEAFLKLLGEKKVNIPIIHTANSAAALDVPESQFDMVRLGISVYGYYPSANIRNKPRLIPSMRVLSRLTLVKKIPAGSVIGYGCTYKAPKDMVIGLVPIGYGDGYDRRLSNKGQMTVKNRFVPVVGRVSMDQTIIDLTELAGSGAELHPGEKVTVISNIRDEPNSVESLAALLDTIPNEIVTRLGPRITRIQA